MAFVYVADVYLCAVLICSLGLLSIFLFTLILTCQYFHRRHRLKGRSVASLPVHFLFEYLEYNILFIFLLPSAASYLLVKCPESRYSSAHF